MKQLGVKKEEGPHVIKRGFYLAFPIGSSLNFFHKNTLNNFTTKLYEAVDLKGERECGVEEISYYHTYYNVEDGELTLTKIVHDSQVTRATPQH